jgi:hypothetical protein
MPDEINDNDNENVKVKVSLKDLLAQDPSLQEELNTLMNENKKTLRQQNQELTNQLETIKNDYTLTAQQKEELSEQINKLQEATMSKEEIAKREQQKIAKQYTEDLEKAKKDSEHWKSKYSSSTVLRNLQDAAEKAEAISSSIVVDILGPKTQLAEVIDTNGKSTGEYKPVVKFNDIDGDGNAITLELSPTDAMKRMKELPDLYGMLFKGTATSGLGEVGSTSGNKGGVTLEQLKNPEYYARWRQENPDLDISKVLRR